MNDPPTALGGFPKKRSKAKTSVLATIKFVGLKQRLRPVCNAHQAAQSVPGLCLRAMYRSKNSRRRSPALPDTSADSAVSAADGSRYGNEIHHSALRRWGPGEAQAHTERTLSTDCRASPAESLELAH